MNKFIVLTLFVVMAVAPSAMAIMGDELLLGGDFDSFTWGWEGTGSDVTNSVTGNGRGGTGNALTFADSVTNLTGLQLAYRRDFFLIPGGNSINPGDLVKISAWAKVSQDFDNQDPSYSAGLGVELRLKLGGNYAQPDFWSNSNTPPVTGLVFGWGGNGGAIGAENLTTDWVQYEYTFEIPDLHDPDDSYTWMEFRVQDRVGHRGDMAAQWDGTFFLDDISVTVVPEPATMILLGLGSLAMLRRKK